MYRKYRQEWHRETFDVDVPKSGRVRERSVIQRHCVENMASAEWPEMMTDRSGAQSNGTGGARQNPSCEDSVGLLFALREVAALRKLLKKQETQIEILEEAIDYARSLIDGIEIS
ncbi:hypothetical protein [Paraburkholderia ultramafica]|uniref:hypothetical protein n=1 Tax=Paraburkholderia ultramafica TaxID=1544867 RepID=UPI0015821CE7|nr:hypothetical protein [Paraburkholderia ultramafica]